MWEIENFELASGRCPVSDFLLSLDKKMDLPFVMKKIDLLAEMGYELRRPHSAPLQDKIYELRIETISGKIRILYFFYDKDKIIFTNGFIKKKGPVGNHHLEIAKRYKKLYLERDKK